MWLHEDLKIKATNIRNISTLPGIEDEDAVYKSLGLYLDQYEVTT